MKLKFFWKTLSWLIIIIVLSILPGSEAKKVDLLHFNNADKVYHFILYFIFAIIFFYDLNKNPYRQASIKSAIFRIFLISLFLGVILEIVQYYFIEGRNGSFYDLLANLAGTIFGLGFFRLYFNYK
ncbi:MAG: VanZ family protein [Bacteroidales bacterium]|nr:VanZ family protein [Bacteroidales bacterium]